MGFIFALAGAVVGGWVSAGGHGFFGVIAGAVIAWLMYQLSAARSQLRKLVDRVENLEQRNRATATVTRAEKRAPETPREGCWSTPEPHKDSAPRRRHADRSKATTEYGRTCH